MNNSIYRPFKRAVQTILQWIKKFLQLIVNPNFEGVKYLAGLLLAIRKKRGDLKRRGFYFFISKINYFLN